MLAEDDGTFRPVEVEIGIESGGQTEIKRGLRAGQRVVVSGAVPDRFGGEPARRRRPLQPPATPRRERTAATRASTPCTATR